MQHVVVSAIVLLSLCSATKSGLFVTRRAVFFSQLTRRLPSIVVVVLSPSRFAVKRGSFGHKGPFGD